jgi:hypothetical protein
VKAKMVDKNRVKNIQEPRGLPPPFFLLGEEGELWGFILDFNVPNVFPPSYGYPPRL